MLPFQHISRSGDKQSHEFLGASCQQRVALICATHGDNAGDGGLFSMEGCKLGIHMGRVSALQGKAVYTYSRTFPEEPLPLHSSSLRREAISARTRSLSLARSPPSPATFL